MDVSEEIRSGNETDTKVNEEEATQISFSLKDLQIDVSTNPEKRSVANNDDDNLKQTGGNTWNFEPQPNMNAASKIVVSSKHLKKTLQNKVETEYLKGKWILDCNPNRDSNGYSEANEIKKSAEELHKTRPNLFLYPPFLFDRRNGTVAVCINTPDYADKDFNLRVARAIREEMNYPFVMYYHKRIDNSTSYMHTPDDEFYVSVNRQWILQE